MAQQSEGPAPVVSTPAPSGQPPVSLADQLHWPESPRQLWERLHRPTSLKRELALVVILALGISMVMKTFFVQTFTIPSGSMENTLLVGDRIMVNLRTDPATLKRGDVIVFEDPGGWIDAPPPAGWPLGVVRKGLEFIGLAPVSKGHLVKRVIGLPGDHLVCCDAQRRMTVNGVVLQESYLYPGELASRDDFNVTVPPARLWVMGDHRSVSWDSRYHLPPGYTQTQEHAWKNRASVPQAPLAAATQATISYDLVVGRVVWRMWPVSRFGGVNDAQ